MHQLAHRKLRYLSVNLQSRHFFTLSCVTPLFNDPSSAANYEKPIHTHSYVNWTRLVTDRTAAKKKKRKNDTHRTARSSNLQDDVTCLRVCRAIDLRQSSSALRSRPTLHSVWRDDGDDDDECRWARESRCCCRQHK